GELGRQVVMLVAGDIRGEQVGQRPVTATGELRDGRDAGPDAGRCARVEAGGDLLAGRAGQRHDGGGDPADVVGELCVDRDVRRGGVQVERVSRQIHAGQGR